MSTQEPTIAVSLTVKNTAEALDFYTQALGAEELFRMPTPDGGIAHAEFQIGNSRIFISDEDEAWHASALPEGVMAPSLLAILSEDCEQSFQKAVDAGAVALNEPELHFWGAKVAMVRDPFGYRWTFREIVEEVSNEEMMARAQKLFGGE